MKNTVSTILCILLATAMAVAAVGIGAVRGWSGQREEALSILSADSELGLTLQSRGMDAANLAVVAARHLTDDDDVNALRRAYCTISGTATAAELVWADGEISRAARSLSEKLADRASVQQSERDRAYISTLTRTLAEGTEATAAYQSAVADYNARLKTSPTGRVAMLLGVQPIEETMAEPLNTPEENP